MLGQNPGVQPFPPPPFGFPAGTICYNTTLVYVYTDADIVIGGLPPPPFGMPGGMIPRTFILRHQLIP
jgi:hypothetical protein